MKIKKGDKVKVIVGKDKGKTGKVLQVLTKKGKISVEGINLMYKNMRPRKQGEKGQKIQFPSPMFISKVALVCPKCGKTNRVGFKKLADKNKVRICSKCREAI